MLPNCLHCKLSIYQILVGRPCGQFSGFFQNIHHQFGQAWMAELYGGQVDRYGEIPVPPILPGFQLRHSRSQYPFPYRNDLAVRLGNRDEFIWRDIAELRVLPSDQGFEADNPVVLERKLWLINQTELFSLHRPR